jgi:sarcosine oxidase subunit beta
MPEVVVVGAGIVGALSALELCERGVDVTLVEAAAPAAGASGGPGQRGVRANGRDPRELPLIRRAHELWAELGARLDADTGYARCGHLLVSETDGADLEAQAERQRRAGIPTEVLDASAVRALEPELAASVRAGAWCPGDGVADHTATTLAAVEAVTRLGGRLRLDTTVTGVETEPEVAVTLPAGERLYADACVLAVNQALPELLGDVPRALPVFAVLPQVLFVRPRDASPVRHLIGHTQRPLSLKTLPTGDVMVTGGRLGRLDRATGRKFLVDDEVRANLADAAATYPALAGAELVAAVVDRADSVSPDLVPIVDTVGDGPRCLFATGWSGHGWAIAPAVAEALARWLTSGTRPEELAPFAAGRFA